MKKGLVVWILFCLSTCLFAQNDEFRQSFEAFRQQVYDNYNEFRNKANREYAEFMRKAWEECKVVPPIAKPKDEDILPVIIADEDLLKPIESTPIKIDGKVLTIPKIEPQPMPLSPVEEEPMDEEKWVDFSFYGTPMRVRFGDGQRFTLARCTEGKVADLWSRMSEKDFNNTIRDCLKIRTSHRMGDWAYLQMLDAMSQACMGNGNEAVLLMAYIYCQSGYKMRLGMDGGRLYMLYATRHIIYGVGSYRLDGENFYIYGKGINQMNICKATFPQEKTLSLMMAQSMELAQRKSEARTLQSQRYPEMVVTVSVNRNMLDFMDGYPTSMVGNDFMTRWAMYANVPLESELQEELLPQMRRKLQGLGEKEAVERLLNWVQTAFVYEYDEKVWGNDRAFFPEETLYYPYSDCEDRAILFTRLVRDLLGLKCILVFYPGHLASAVCFTEDVKGDYIIIGNNRYVVCDPTFVGASVGRTMPNMDNEKASAIILE